MSRPKGFKLSDEQKKRMQAGRKKKKEVEQPVAYTKQKLYFTGEEKNGFDFWPIVRNILRPLHQYDLCNNIEMDIIKLAYWNNIPVIKEKLSEYFVLKKKA